LLPFESIAEACSADVAGHYDISGDLAVSHFRVQDGCFRICLAAVSLCGHVDARKDSVAVGAIGKSLFQGGENTSGAPRGLTLCQRK
jgi:hypothetical protein